MIVYTELDYDQFWHSRRIGHVPLTIIHRCIGAFFVPVVEGDVSESEDMASETGNEDSEIWSQEWEIVSEV